MSAVPAVAHGVMAISERLQMRKSKIVYGLLLLLICAPEQLGAQTVEIENIGITGHGTELQGDWLAFSVAEWAEERDLNGDGDLSDQVLHIYRTSTGILSNLRIATGPSEIGIHGSFISFFAHEASQGRTDINGDGDAEDAILSFLNTETGRIGLVRLPAYGLAIENDLAVYGVRESDFGGDLNGDGDTDDLVLHSLALDSMRNRNHRLALTRSDLFPLLLQGGLVATHVGEGDQGGLDLNGDGDIGDIVLVLVQPLTGGLRNLQLAAHTTNFVGSNHLVFGVPESAQGGEDRNGDGDAGDIVAHVHEVASGATENIGVAGWVRGGGREHAALLVRENEEGGVDLNGDGDAIDWVLHAYDVARGSLVTSGLGMANERFEFRDRIAARVWEQVQGNLDLNGDGDATDQVMHVFDPKSGTVRNLGIAADLPPPFQFRNVLPVAVSEPKQGMDLNGDGDTLDVVLHVYDAVRDRLTNVGLALHLDISTRNTSSVDGTLVAFGVSEQAQGGADLNGDGDLGDFVLHFYDALRETTVPTTLLVEGTLSRNRVPAGIYEGGSLDLNGDGDMEDVILQLVTYHAPPAVRLKVNGSHPDSNVVSTPGPAEFALDMSSGSSETAFDWYLAIVVGAQVYWMTPTGFLQSPAPLLSKHAAVDFEDLTLADFSLPPGATVTFVFLLVAGAEVAEYDFVTAVVAP